MSVPLHRTLPALIDPQLSLSVFVGLFISYPFCWKNICAFDETFYKKIIKSRSRNLGFFFKEARMQVRDGEPIAPTAAVP